MKWSLGLRSLLALTHYKLHSIFHIYAKIERSLQQSVKNKHSPSLKISKPNATYIGY